MEPVPEYFIDTLTKIGGVNRFGEPRYRIVDGRTERRFPNGPLKYLSHYTVHWEDGFVNGIWTKRKIVTPHGIERYVIEEWWPPELCMPNWEKRRYYYDPDTRQKVDLLGEPPRRGMYRPWLTLEDAQGNALPPTQIVLDFVAACIQWTQRECTLEAEDAAPQERDLERAILENLERQRRTQKAFSAAVYDMVTNCFAASAHRILLANPTEGLLAHHRRDPDWDRNWDERLKREKLEQGATHDNTRPTGDTISL